MTPNAKRVSKYFLLLPVLKNPSTIKNTNIGKAILPNIENIFDKYNKNQAFDRFNTYFLDTQKADSPILSTFYMLFLTFEFCIFE